MPTLAERMETLKRKLQTSDNFSDTMAYFFDDVTSQSAFMDRGKASRFGLLEQVLVGIGESLLGRKATPEHLLVIKLKDFKFFHGACFMEGRPLNFIYFRDIDMGMVTCMTDPASVEVTHTRFTCFRVDKEIDGFLRADSRSAH